MKNKYKLWVARDRDGFLYLFNEKPERLHTCGGWRSEWFYSIRYDLFPDLTWEDEPIEVEIRPVITDLNIKAKEYANNVTDNEEIRELIINAYKAGYNI